MSYRLTQGWPQHIDSGAFVDPETNPAYLAWLADGGVPEAHPNPRAPEEVRLAEIDQAAQLTPRAFRELVILMTEGFRLATSGTLDLKAIVPGVAQVFVLEEEAAALREQLNQ